MKRPIGRFCASCAINVAQSAHIRLLRRPQCLVQCTCAVLHCFTPKYAHIVRISDACHEYQCTDGRPLAYESVMSDIARFNTHWGAADPSSIASLHVRSPQCQSITAAIISNSQEHPHLGPVCYMVHPCHTSTALSHITPGSIRPALNLLASRWIRTQERSAC